MVKYCTIEGLKSRTITVVFTSSIHKKSDSHTITFILCALVWRVLSREKAKAVSAKISLAQQIVLQSMAIVQQKTACRNRLCTAALYNTLSLTIVLGL